VSQGGNTTDATNDAITPIATTYTNNTPNGASAMAISGTLTGSGATITAVKYINPALTNGLNRWSAVSDSTAGTTYTNWNGTSFTNLEANATLPVNAPANAGKLVGLATGNAGGADPQYFAINHAGNTTGSWLVGQVNVSTGPSGSSTLALSAGSLGLTKSQTSGTTDLTSNYSYGSATINVGSQLRTGDLNGDGAVNNLDIDLEAAAIRASSTASVNDLNHDTLVNSADLSLLVGTLVDINGGGVGGAHGTYFGDATLDAVVGQPDLNAVLQNFGKTGALAIWASGNFYKDPNNDTVVGQPDLNNVLQNFGKTGAGGGQLASVPEPSGLLLLAFGGLAAVGFKKRIRRK
jgi:hypothetical protein